MVETYTVWLNVDDEGYADNCLYALKDDAVHAAIRALEAKDGDAHVHLGTFESDTWEAAKLKRDELVDAYHTRQAALRG
jgi:hypothetical protein